MTKVDDAVVKADSTADKNTHILDEDICKY